MILGSRPRDCGSRPGSVPAVGTGLRRRVTSGLVLLRTSLATAVPCRAEGLVIEAPNLTNRAPGFSGSFDVLLVNTNPAGGASYVAPGPSLCPSGRGRLFTVTPPPRGEKLAEGRVRRT
jgi:hypothetical protein